MKERAGIAKIKQGVGIENKLHGQSENKVKGKSLMKT